jgi:hypothetical protein
MCYICLKRGKEVEHYQRTLVLSGEKATIPLERRLDN